MVSLDEERTAAAQADSAIRNLSPSTIPLNTEAVVQVLRKAIDAAITAAGMTISSQEPLNEARGEAAIALSRLIDALNKGLLTADMLESARRATEVWKNRLGVS